MNNRYSLAANFVPTAPLLYPDLNSQFKNVPKELAEDLYNGQEEIVKQGMQKHEARVCLILDVSASMQNPNKFFEHEFKGNQVQKLINKALALAFLFDDNQQVEVFPFGDQVFVPPIILDRNNFTHATRLIMDAIGGQFRLATNYAEPVKAIRQYYFCDAGKRIKPLPCSDAPLFALFITDGEPNEKKIEAMNEFASASHMAIFFKFIALKGNQQDLSFKFLSAIDDHEVKNANTLYDPNLFYIDNSDLVVLNHPDELTMKSLINEYRPWLIEAKEKQLLTYDPGIELMEKNAEGRRTAASVSQNTHAMFNHRKENESQQEQRVEKASCCTIL